MGRPKNNPVVPEEYVSASEGEASVEKTVITPEPAPVSKLSSHKAAKENGSEIAALRKLIEGLQRDREEDKKKYAEEVGMLKAVADKGALAKWEAKQDRKIVRVVKVKFYDGELVTSWRSVLDRVWKDNDNNWHERQTYEITTESGATHQMDIRDFGTLLESRPAKVVKRDQHFEDDDNGVEVLTETFTLQLEGREDTFTLKGNFVN